MSKNLWPENLVDSDLRSPVSILREQAAFLEKSTSNIISALVKKVEVLSTENPFPPRKVWSLSPNVRLGELNLNLSGSEASPSEDLEPQPFGYDFYITAPALGSYRYLLFRMLHGFQLYPVTLFVDGDLREELQANSGKLIARSEEEFEQCLSKIFNTSKTRRVISVLFAQVESA